MALIGRDSDESGMPAQGVFGFSFFGASFFGASVFGASVFFGASVDVGAVGRVVVGATVVVGPVVEVEVVGIDVAEATARTLLTGIGTVDLLLATLLVMRRWRAVAIYAACWGLLTAGSRMSAYGLEMGGYESFMRAAHFGLPAALAVYWSHRPARVKSWRRRSPVS